MGTEVQSKMHLPGYYSLRDLNESSSKVSWPQHHEHKNFEQQFNFLSTRRGIDIGYNKEQLRQTILKHESIFRQQVHELHRLYRVQREMMNELKSRELNKHMTHVGTSQSTPFSSSLLSRDEPKSHVLGSRMLDSNSTLYISGDDSSFSQYNHLKGKFLQSGCSSAQNGSGLKNGELLEFQYKNVQRRLFDLERPADDNEDGDPGVSSLSVSENYPTRKIPDVTPHREGKFAMNNGGSYNCNGGATASNMYPWGNRGYVDSNGPIQVQEMNLETERRQKGWLSFNLENGCNGGTNSFAGNIPVQIESAKVQSSKIETSTNRRIFGVEIPEKSSSTAASFAPNGTSASAPHFLDQLTIGLQKDKTNSEVLSVSSWNKFPSSWNQNFSGNSSNGTLDQSNVRSTTSMLDRRVAEGKKLLADSNSRSIPGPDFSSQNGFSFGSSSVSKDLQVRWPSVGFSNQNGTTPLPASEQLAEETARRSFKGLGSAVDLNMDAFPVDVKQNQENRDTGLTWLYNGKSTKDKLPCPIEKKGTSQSAFQDFSSAASVSNTNHRRKEGDSESSSKKILGFPIFEVESKDMPSTASVNGTDPPPAESGRCPIDLNLCFVEEEVEVEEDAPTPFLSSKTGSRTHTVIDLEMPAATEPDTEIASVNESLAESDPQQQHSSNFAAAEALMVLSSSKIDNHQNDNSHQQLETIATDSLHWFAEIISSYQSDSESDDVDELDYFELMTLNLTETKEEDYHHTSHALENQKDEQPLTKRPRRGQPRRGRQRKDFQRDILPNLTSLSRNEVTQDFQQIEGLILSTGGNWQSSLTQKNNARRKKRSGSGGSLLPPIPEPSSSNLVNQAEPVTPERSLTGWGKRTRRPPRQRCSISITTPPLSVK